MLTLYYRPSCPYCLRVLSANEAIKAPLVLRDISADPDARAELLQIGGKTQVPYLADSVRGVGLYESLAIIDYLATHYGAGVVPVTAPTGNVCPIE